MSKTTVTQRTIGIGLLAAIVIAFWEASWRLEDAPIVIPSDESAPASYTEAKTLLVSGKDTPRAIALLQHAMLKDPRCQEYHQALACAYTERAAVIYRALQFRMLADKQSPPFLFRLLVWESGRAAQRAAGPKPSNRIRLRDDGKPFNLGYDDAANVISDLYGKSGQQLTIAQHEAKTGSDRAEAFYYTAWCKHIFSRMQFSGGVPGEPNSIPAIRKVKGLCNQNAAVDAINSSLSISPKNALYWQSAGDFALAMSSDDFDDSVDSPLRARSKICYRKSLSLDPNNARLWLTLAGENYHNKSVAAEDALQSVKYDPKNAYALMVCIGFILDPTHYMMNSLNASTPYSKRDAVDQKVTSSLNARDMAAARIADSLIDVLPNATHLEGQRPEPSAPEILQPALKLVDWSGIMLMVLDVEVRESSRDIAGLTIAEAINGGPANAEKHLEEVIAGVSPYSQENMYTERWLEKNKNYTLFALDEVKLNMYHQRARIYMKYGPQSKASAANADSKRSMADSNAHSVMLDKMVSDNYDVLKDY